jgi:endonuclease/exonuclease/phosphatase family metal-dependent hydrolase
VLRTGRKQRVQGLFGVVLVVSLVAGLQAPAQADERRELRFMTRNLYLGASLTPIFTSGSINQLIGQATVAWGQVQASNFPARAERLAQEIASEKPDLVGLQEVTLYRSGPFNPGAPATTPVLDFLAILEAELAERGLPYEVASQVAAFDGELTVLGATGLMDIRLTDRDVILARTDLPTSLMKVTNPRSGLYDAALPIPLPSPPAPLPPTPPLVVRRGWTSVDVMTRGKSFKFIDTHLEAFHPLIQQFQSLELLAGPANTSRPVVMAGDFNSAADNSGTASYQNIVNAGFSDAWAAVFPGDPGYTCCHSDDLTSGAGDLTSRIDLLFFRGADMQATEAEIVGEAEADKTLDGLWPSDHAGVLATISVGPKS